MKIFYIFVITIILFFTILITLKQPKMHKEFNFNVIEKILNINADGSSTIIEKTTTTERVTK